MPIKEFEFFHGAILAKILRNELPTNLRMVETNSLDAWSVYRVNDEIVLYMKYCASPRNYKKTPDRISWTFNFKPSDLAKLRSMSEGGTLYLALICTRRDLSLDSSEVCMLNVQEISKLIEIDSENNQSFTVFCERNKQLRVRGSIFGNEIKIPRNRIDCLDIPG